MPNFTSPKDWDEITSDEKIERMREIIKSQSQNISRLQVDLHRIRRAFVQHSHTEKSIVVPFDEYGGEGLAGIAALNSSGKYF